MTQRIIDSWIGRLRACERLFPGEPSARTASAAFMVYNPESRKAVSCIGGPWTMDR